MTTPATKKLKITMSERLPVTIDPELWPVIARAYRHDGSVESQANNEYDIVVREHGDGRRIVYGSHEAGDGGQCPDFRATRVGFLIDRDPTAAETIRAIRRCGGAIGDDRLAADCIGDLPSEEI